MRRQTTIATGLACLVALASCSSGHKDKDAAAYVRDGLAAQQHGDVSAAAAAFEKAVSKDPGNAFAHYNLGVIAQQQAHDDVALQEYGKALVANPKLVPALFNEATVYSKSDPPLAITTYRRVVALQPQAPTAYLNLGLLEFQTGLQKQGLADLSTALHQDPTLVNRLSPDVKGQVGRYALGAGASSSATPSAAPRATAKPRPSASPSR